MRQLVRQPAFGPVPVLLCLCVLIGAGLPAWAQDDEPRVLIRKIERSCEGEGCANDGRVVIELDGSDPFFGNLGEHFPALRRFEVRPGGEDGHNVFFYRGEGGGYLGVQLVGLTEALRAHFGVPEGLGVMVSEVGDDTPAWRAGIQAGDVVTAVDGEEIRSSGELARAIRGAESGASVGLEVWRDGKPLTLTAQVERREPPARTRAFFLNCQDDEDCNQVQVRGLEVGCEGEGCTLEVTCKDGDCTCTVDGETRDCAALDGFHRLDRRPFRYRQHQQ
ncbi:MAG TPA: PDZ domain-containing protein [Thermoanaerobaculia bacterium]|nr:PDZ domain-containing protein [Thermoanaerobaculia bacterium]